MPFITANVTKSGQGVMGQTITSIGQTVLLSGVTVSADDNGIYGMAGTSGSSLLLMGHVLSANSAGVKSDSHNYKVLISSTGVASGGTDGVLLSETNGAGGNFVENWAWWLARQESASARNTPTTTSRTWAP
jgi:hypothetical protein